MMTARCSAELKQKQDHLLEQGLPSFEAMRLEFGGHNYMLMRWVLALVQQSFGRQEHGSSADLLMFYDVSSMAQAVMAQVVTALLYNAGV